MSGIITDAILVLPNDDDVDSCSGEREPKREDPCQSPGPGFLAVEFSKGHPSSDAAMADDKAYGADDGGGDGVRGKDSSLGGA